MKPCCRATEPGETFGRGQLGLLPLRRFASQPVQEWRESGAIAEMRLLHSLDLDRILDRLGHPRRVGHVVNLRAALCSCMIDGDRRKVGVDRDTPHGHVFPRRVEFVVAEGRSEERPGGTKGLRTVRSRGRPETKKKKSN